MATNFDFDIADVVSLTIADATSANAPVCVGSITGVLLADVAAGAAGLVGRKGIATLSVKAINGSGNVAVAQGDAIYFVSGDTPKLSKKDTGVLYGYAMAGITSGSTATIQVLLK